MFATDGADGMEDDDVFEFRTDEELRAMSRDERDLYDLQMRNHQARQNQHRTRRDRRNEQQRDAANAAQAGEEERRRAEQQAEEQATNNVRAERELNMRKAMRILNPKGTAAKEVPAYEVLAEAVQTQAELDYLDQKVTSIQETILRIRAQDPSFASDVHLTELAMLSTDLNVLRDHIHLRTTPLREMEIDKWEQGELTPSEFLQKMAEYNAKMDVADANAMVYEKDADKKYVRNADQTIHTKRMFTDEERTQRSDARRTLYEETARTLEELLRVRPQALTMEQARNLDGTLTESQIWAMYSKQEKEDIIKQTKDRSKLNIYITETQEDIETISKEAQEAKIGFALQKMQRMVTDTLMNTAGDQTETDKAKDTATGSSSTDVDIDGIVSKLTSPVRYAKSGWHQANQALGIEWTNVGELIEAFKEMMEGIKEVKKRKRMGKVARIAVAMGSVASWVPGLGGHDLMQVLEEQQEHKMNEVKDSFKKELGDNRNDYGFTDLFGSDGNGGKLKEYAGKGDMNRTRGVLEFAAGKGLLFNIEEADPKTHEFPGGLKIKDLVPHEWTENQVNTYFDNLKYMNNQGKAAATKAGAEYVDGRSTVEGYLEPFKGAVNGLAIHFAKGIVEKALVKVVDGEMSTRLTLIIIDAWENNALFRKHVPREWLDRLCGDGKQMMIGMIKYDKDMLLQGIRNGETDLTKIHDENGRESQLGNLVVAVRSYLVRKDPSLKSPANKDKFEHLQAKILASQMVTLPNGKTATIYSPELQPYLINYHPDQMRDVPVTKLGDDFFIKRSEIIRGNLEVVKAVGGTTQNGFAEPVKARYFFSHIIDAYNELRDMGNPDKNKTGDALELAEMNRAADQMRAKARGYLDGWIKQALASGGEKILEERHKMQEGYLLQMLVEKELVSLEKIEEAARTNNRAAQILLKNVAESETKDVDPSLRARARAAAVLYGGRGGRGN